MIGIYCDYDEFKPETYRGMIAILGEVKQRFDTNNPEQDLENAKEYIAKTGVKEYYCMSSVDHYFMDLEPEDDTIEDDVE